MYFWSSHIYAYLVLYILRIYILKAIFLKTKMQKVWNNFNIKKCALHQRMRNYTHKAVLYLHVYCKLKSKIWLWRNGLQNFWRCSMTPKKNCRTTFFMNLLSGSHWTLPKWPAFQAQESRCTFVLVISWCHRAYSKLLQPWSIPGHDYAIYSSILLYKLVMATSFALFIYLNQAIFVKEIPKWFTGCFIVVNII